MNAVDELWEYIQKKNIQQFHITWGPNADTLTTEERAEYLLNIMKGMESGKYEPKDWVESSPKKTVEEWLIEILKGATKKE